MLGMAIRTVNPAEPSTTSHWETEPETRHAFVAASPEDAQDGGVADARFPPSRSRRYRDGLLPG